MAKQFIQEHATKLKKIFKQLDKDGDGFISADDLGAFFQPENLTEAEIKEMMTKYDADQDGSINDTEFLNLMADRLKDFEDIETKPRESVFDEDSAAGSSGKESDYFSDATLADLEYHEKMDKKKLER